MPSAQFEVETAPPLEHAGLRALYAYWLELARQADGLPGIQAFDPLHLPKLLPHIWILEVDPESHRLRMRLAGESINAIYGRNVGGNFFADVFVPEDVPDLVERYRRTLGPPAIYRSTGRVYAAEGRYSMGERVGLPMIGRDGATSTVIGGTVYADRMFDRDHPRVMGDVAEFFAIRAANHRAVEIAGG